jgi:hypothetical protein
MTTALMPVPKQQYFDSPNGRPLAGGKVYTYAAGTTTPKATYTDSAGLVPQANPIILNARGEPDSPIYWDGSYKVVLKDSAGSTIYTVDNYKSDPFGVVAFIASAASSAGSSLLGFIQSTTGAVLRTVQNKLRDHFGSKDYGAVGDGITDDRNAINTMLTNLTSDFTDFELYFPKGSYLIGSDLTIPTGAALRFHAGAKLIIPNGVTVTMTNTELLAGRQQIFQCTGTGKVVGTIRNDLIFPEWWGAIADGLHAPVGADFSARAAAAARNAPALQAALNFAGYQYSINGLTGTVSLTYGYYVYDTTLSIPLSVNVIGYGIGSAVFYYAATGNAIECVSTNNHLLKDFFIAPIAGPTWNYTSGYGLYMNGVSTPVVDNVWSSGFGGGTFYFLSVIEGRIRGCISDNSNGPAFIIRGVGQGTVLSNCVTAGTDGGACFDIQSGYDWHLIGCTAKDGGTGTNGFYLNAVENINMTACGCHDINHDGIVLTASTLNCTLTSCFVNGASTGSSGSYGAFNISGTRNKLIAPKVTQNTPTYSYALILGGGGVDCTYCEENFISGTAGIILDAQPTGSNVTKIRKVSTANATPVNIWAKSLNNNCGTILEATVLAKQQGASGATAMYKFVTYARTNTTNTALLSGPTSIYSYESDALLNATWVLTDSTANAGVVSLQITGLAAGGTVDWEAIVTSIAVTG